MSKVTTAEIKQMQTSVANGLVKFADAIGSEDAAKTSQYGFTPGIGLKTESNLLVQKSEEIKQGVFNVLFTGVFSGGKSTLINALVGKKLLPTSIKPETPTISKIWFGMPDEKVTVVYSDDKEKAARKGKKPGERELITLREYQEDYRLQNPQIDPEAIDHVEIQLTDNVFENLSQFVDSLGLDSAAKEDQITKEYETKANAIVFLMNATKPLEISEQDRIAAKYFSKQLKNVFFVINRFNSLNSQEEREDAINRYNEFLSQVFVDSRGNVDKSLMKKRVFFVNARGAESLRAEGTYKILVGGKEVEMPLTIDETGVPELENALSEFLLSDSKYKEAYLSELPKLQDYFVQFRNTKEKRLNLLQSKINDVIAEKNAKEAAVKKIEGKINDIRKLCDSFVRELSVSVSQEYSNFTSSVRADWDTYFESEASNIKFGGWKAIQIAIKNAKKKFGSQDDEVYDREIQEVMAPVTDAIFVQHSDGTVGGYVGKKLEDFKKDLASNFENKVSKDGGFIDSIEALCEDISEYMDSIDIDMNEILRSVYQSLGVDVNAGVDFNGSLGQALVALLLGGDWDTAINRMGNKTSNFDFIKDMIKKTVIEYIIYIIVTAITGYGFIYLIIRGVIGIFRISTGGSKLAREALAKSKEPVCSGLENNNASITANVSGQFNRNLNKGLKPMLDIFEGKLNDEVASLNKAIDDIKNKTVDAETEKKRFAKVEALMVEAYNMITKAVNGKTYSSAEEILR